MQVYFTTYIPAVWHSLQWRCWRGSCCGPIAAKTAAYEVLWFAPYNGNCTNVENILFSKKTAVSRSTSQYHSITFTAQHLHCPQNDRNADHVQFAVVVKWTFKFLSENLAPSDGKKFSDSPQFLAIKQSGVTTRRARLKSGAVFRVNRKTRSQANKIK